MKKLGYTLVAALLLSLAGCASKDLPAGNYDASEAGKVKKVAPGVVISSRAIKFHSKNVETGSTSNPGADYVDGGRGYEYVIRLNSGEIVSVAQAEDLKFKANQHVLVIYGSTTRVMPDEGSEN